MLKVSSIFSHTKKYFTKNTARAKLERNTDLAMVSGLALSAQISRCKNWQAEDFAFVSALATIFINTVYEAYKNRMDLFSIKKRAKSIKNSTNV